MMDGRILYGFYEDGGSKILTPWDHLTNEDQARWESVAESVRDWIDIDED